MPHAPTAYAGIGSRRTPDSILALMRLIGTRLAQRGHLLRSGAAPGADQAFEEGCDAANGHKEIFIPWNGFQDRRHHASQGVFCIQTPRAMELASELHPNWAACSDAARKLHARNCRQILGPNLDNPVSDVICWTPNGSGSGGTGQAIRLARKFEIPVWDLGDYDIESKFRSRMDLEYI